ncbi:hypothetical protein [Eikenella sp. HMSC061C02]|uniref:hypothetical protein n=1 Tax=Eikenella sp. HMSC061C02 TaxID=1715021 RepID=UPI0008A1F991|nr:hypothetical protein [Eikenella sp. HMSC061C02]OFN60608.1 hypothetical protein HMPREF2541_07870 [Eikenella sp. HMSC061C02]DAO92339.1 MAG TPA: hypothetical protein [Caudoviricetes sp.]
MATVTIMIADTPRGVMLKITSDERLPDPGEDSGSIAQNLSLIAMELIKQEFKAVTGKEFRACTVQ